MESSHVSKAYAAQIHAQVKASQGSGGQPADPVQAANTNSGEAVAARIPPSYPVPTHDLPESG